MNPGLDAVHKCISETLIMFEARIKSEYCSLNDNGSEHQADGPINNLHATDFLVSEQAIHNCANTDLVRRAVDQTQLAVIPQIRV